MEAQEKAIHISLHLTLNEDTTWSYKSPKVEKNIQFALPIDMLTSKLLGDYIEKTVNGMKADWDTAVKEYKKEKAEEEREKAVKVEVSV